MGIKARKDEASKKLLDLSMDAPRSPEIALSKYLNGASQLQISRILSDKAISEAAAERLSKEHALGELFSGLVLRDYFGAVDDAAFGRFGLTTLILTTGDTATLTICCRSPLDISRLSYMLLIEDIISSPSICITRWQIYQVTLDFACCFLAASFSALS